MLGNGESVSCAPRPRYASIQGVIAYTTATLCALCLTSLSGCGDEVPVVGAPATPRVEPRPEGRFVIGRAALDVDDPRRVARVVLGDCDGDGLVDAVTLGPATRSVVHVGRGGGRFEAVESGLPVQGYEAGALVDLDGDGRDDLVAADDSVVAFRNLGGCHFGPAQELAPRAEGAVVQVLATDVNLDGLTDLSVTRRISASAPHRLLIGRGDGGFDEFAPPPTPGYPERRQQREFIGFGMYYADVDGDGAQDLFGLLDQSQGWFSWGERGGELGQRRDEDMTAVFSQVDPMSLSPLDFDRDGRVDWFVSGVLSRSLLLRHQGGRSLRNQAERAGVGGVGDDFAWGSYAFDADLDGWTDLLVLRVGVDQPHPVLPAPGPTDLFLNRHDGTFAEVGALVIGLQLRSKPLVCGPSSPRGEVVCFAVDTNGPVMLLNNLRARGRQAVLRLRGTVSAPDATGARVTVEGASPPQVFLVSGQCPYGGEHARALQVPLGDRELARVTIAWPSGLVQRGVELRADVVHTVVEPRALTVNPRRLPANGSATAEVVVDPRAVGASRVSLGLTGAAQWVGDATTDAEGRVHRTLRAPATSGEARVTLSLDDVALRVQPRVVFAR
jgi:hypothetical protein